MRLSFPEKILHPAHLLLLLALAGTACGQRVTPTDTGAETQSEQVTQVEEAVADPTEAPPEPEPTAVANTEAPTREAPVATSGRIPPPITAQTAVANTQLAANAPTPEPVALPSHNIEFCKLPSRPIDDAFAYSRRGIPRHPGFTPSTGTVEVAVLFVDYSDARASSSPEQELALLYPAVASEFIREASYGRMELVFKPHPTWITMGQPSSYYQELVDSDSETDERAVIQEAVTLADPIFDFSNTDLVLVIANPQANEGIFWLYIFSAAEDAQGIQADGASIRTGLSVGGQIRDPESEEALRNNNLSRWLGVSMGLMYQGYRDDTLFPDLTSEERGAATGSFSLLGNTRDTAHAPGLFAFERWQLGWLDDNQIFCQLRGEETTELTAIGQSGGMKSVMIPLAERRALVVESRRAEGVDQNLIKSGALIYTVDTSVETNGAPIRVLPAIENDLMRDQSPLAQGESFTYCNITITNVMARPDGDTVRVIIPDQISCPEADPTVQAAIAAQPTAAPVAPAPMDICGIETIASPTQAEISLGFVNDSGFEAVVYWEDINQSPAQLAKYFRLNNGFTLTQESYDGHKWIVQEPGEATLLEYNGSADVRQRVLLKPPVGSQ